MKAEQIRQSLEMDRPTRIVTTSGQDYTIHGGTRWHLHPDGNVLAYFAPNGVVVLIDVEKITEVIQ